ncbi:50S ribosomal protein L10 [Luteibaculum oceani]|uniref:Large ribosomal subunit protein uL10 n=1 Tax=Luteibaculum oceani TaxID=1294296 RepID=A0A5C6V8E0_9FLAO|nr:50S ribosomal protein L10 [Luteibaculum oceani]TXC81622.1 50S ribosomal protein L10 [Luteibaculum oceani]
MTKSEKNQMIEDLVTQLEGTSVLYIADTAELDAEQTSNLRRECFKKNIKLSVVKNTLLKKAMDRVEGKDYSELESVLAGPTAIMIAETGNVPAKLIQQFRKKSKKPVLKGAWVDEAVYIGDNQLEALVNIKSKDEVLAEVIGLLQSPAKNVISALKSSGGDTIAGLVKALSEKE